MAYSVGSSTGGIAADEGHPPTKNRLDGQAWQRRTHLYPQSPIICRSLLVRKVTKNTMNGTNPMGIKEDALHGRMAKEVGVQTARTGCGNL